MVDRNNIVDSTDPDDPYYEATVTAVPELMTRARLYESTWTNHIQEEHPEFEELSPEEVLSTLEQPAAVHISTTRPEDSVVFIRETNTFQGDILNVHVPVRLHAPDSGRVTTTYLSSAPYAGKKIWPTEDEDGP